MLLNRDDWYELSRDLDWTLSYVSREAAFPPEWTGAADLPADAWQAWEEPFRISYRDYVAAGREQELGAAAVSGALARAATFARLDPGQVAAAQLHVGAITLARYLAVTMQSRFCRFAPSPRWRSLGVFGMLNETRHAQLDLRLSHDLLRHDPRFDWAQRAFHTNSWVVLAVRNFLDDIMLSADCVEAALAVSLTVEHGLTGLQFAALAGGAAEAGDINWSGLLSSIQTDEARQAQPGFPTLGVLMAHDPERAQRVLDVAFWRSARLFQLLAGPAMDYYTPLRRRKMSFQEFMLEYIVSRHERVLADYGLRRPWYWDQFLASLQNGHHAMHLGMWFWRPTLWWNPPAGISPVERKWLEEKYPGWEDNWGPLWDQVIANVRSGNFELTLPETLPALCNLTQLPLGSARSRRELQPATSVYQGRLYHFDSEISKWCFDIEPGRYAGHLTVIDRYIAGQIQPMTLAGCLRWMGLTPERFRD